MKPLPIKKHACLRAAAVLLLLSLSLPALPFSPVSELYPSGHWVYDAISLLSLESGSATMAVDAPMSAAELRLYLSSVRIERLGSVGRELYRRVDRELSERSPLIADGFATIDVRPTVSLSARLRSGGDNALSFDDVASFNETSPLVSVPVYLGFSPYVTAFSDFSIGEGYWSSTQGDLSSNVPTDSSSFDVNIPGHSYLAVGNSFFTASIGRGALSIGRSNVGSMILSDTADRLDHFSLALFSPHIRFSLTPIELAPDRFAYYHSLKIMPASWLLITMTEASLVNSSLDPRYLNPAMVFHSYAGWRDDYGDDASNSSKVGSEFGLSLEVVPARNVRLYGQFVMNQFQTEYELETYGDAGAVIPNALGGMVGLEYARPYRNGYGRVTVECSYANPWLYVLENHDISYYASRKELVAPSGYPSQGIDTWLGSPYGPDCFACNVGLSYERPADRSLGLYWRTLFRGDNGDDFLSSDTDDYYPTTTAEASDETPTGSARLRHRLSVAGSRFVTAHLELTANVGYNCLASALAAGSPFASCAVTWSVR